MLSLRLLSFTFRVPPRSQYPPGARRPLPTSSGPALRSFTRPPRESHFLQQSALSLLHPTLLLLLLCLLCCFLAKVYPHICFGVRIVPPSVRIAVQLAFQQPAATSALRSCSTGIDPRPRLFPRALSEFTLPFIPRFTTITSKIISGIEPLPAWFWYLSVPPCCVSKLSAWLLSLADTIAALALACLPSAGMPT